MWLLGIATFYGGVVAIALVRAIRQFRCYRVLEPAAAENDPDLPGVAVIVPARNEARTIGPCLSSLLAQDYPRSRLSLTAVDDGSSDGTSEILRRLRNADDRLRLIEVRELPAGWTGKTHACWRGACASQGAAEWLCFIDADTRVAPSLVRSAVSFARQHRIDMLSLEPFQELNGLLDRAVMPVGFLALAATQDLRRLDHPDCIEATANGQFILIRASAYFAIGGHSAVREEISEDSALARLAKGRRFSLALMGAERLIRTRMHANGSALWEGLSKNATDTFGGIGPSLVVAGLGLFVGWAFALLLILGAVAAAQDPSAPNLLAAAVAVVASLAVLATLLGLLRRLRVPLRYAWLFPLGCTVGAAIVVNAALRRKRGLVPWKGRVYALGGDVPSGD